MNRVSKNKKYICVESYRNEVEKANPDVFNLFLQILDDGHLTDSSGRHVSFKNCIIVMTTNLGSRVIERESPILSKEKSFGFKTTSAGLSENQRTKIELLINPDGTFSLKPPVKREVTAEDEEKFVKITGLVMEELKKFFRPEFLNRIDDIIMFTPLSNPGMPVAPK